MIDIQIGEEADEEHVKVM